MTLIVNMVIKLQSNLIHSKMVRRPKKISPSGPNGDFHALCYSKFALEGLQLHLEMPPAMRDHTSDLMDFGVRLVMKASNWCNRAYSLCMDWE